MTDYNPHHIPTKSFALIGQKAIILNTDNKILLLQRSDKSGNGGKWSLPGGALEHGEDPLAGIQREISEETQLEVSDLKPFHVKSYVNANDEFVVIIGYFCQANSQGVQLNWEHEQYKWLTKDESLNLDLTPDAHTFLDHMGEDLFQIVHPQS